MVWFRQCWGWCRLTPLKRHLQRRYPKIINLNQERHKNEVMHLYMFLKLTLKLLTAWWQRSSTPNSELVTLSLQLQWVEKTFTDALSKMEHRGGQLFEWSHTTMVNQIGEVFTSTRARGPSSGVQRRTSLSLHCYNALFVSEFVKPPLDQITIFFVCLIIIK